MRSGAAYREASAIGRSAPRSVLLHASLFLCSLLAACSGQGATPTPVVIVVTAAPSATQVSSASNRTPAAGPEGKPAAAPKPASKEVAVAPSKPAATPKPAAPSPTAAPTPQTLKLGRTTSYRGLEFSVVEARTGQTIEGQSANRGKTLVGLRMRAYNPHTANVRFNNPALNTLLRLEHPDGTKSTALSAKPFDRPTLPPRESIEGWLYFELDRPAPLEPMKLVFGGGGETPVEIALSGPEPVIAQRSFEYLRSTDPVRGLLWSVSGGTLRLDIPGQQANPGQEFIVLKVRATNPSASEIRLRNARQGPQGGLDYLRLEADNGVQLQPSAELAPLPAQFLGHAEQDALYAWQIPHGSRNPSLIILSPDGSQHKLELGPLPPP
jgi:hypothetical protein